MGEAHTFGRGFGGGDGGHSPRGLRRGDGGGDGRHDGGLVWRVGRGSERDTAAFCVQMVGRNSSSSVETLTTGKLGPFVELVGDERR